VEAHADPRGCAERHLPRGRLIRRRFQVAEGAFRRCEHRGIILLHRPEVQHVTDGRERHLERWAHRDRQGPLPGCAVQGVLQEVGDVQGVRGHHVEDLDVPVVLLDVPGMEAPAHVALAALVRVPECTARVAGRGRESVPQLRPPRIVLRPVLLQRLAHLLQVPGRGPSEQAHLADGVIEVERREDQGADSQPHRHADHGLHEVAQ
jgi:hypothetical protein